MPFLSYILQYCIFLKEMWCNNFLNRHDFKVAGNMLPSLEIPAMHRRHNVKTYSFTVC